MRSFSAIVVLGFAVLAQLGTVDIARAQDEGGPCRDMLAATEAAHREVTLRADGQGLAYLLLSFVPSPDSDILGTNTFYDINRFTASDGQTWDGLDQVSCDGGTMLAHEYSEGASAAGPPNTEVFDPPLPWLHLPLVPGATWNWGGTLTTTSPEGTHVDHTSFFFSVGAPETVETVAGPMEATPVEYTIVLDDARVPVLRTVSWIVTSPVYAVVKRERFFGANRGTPDQTFTLQSASWVSP